MSRIAKLHTLVSIDSSFKFAKIEVWEGLMMVTYKQGTTQFTVRVQSASFNWTWFRESRSGPDRTLQQFLNFFFPFCKAWVIIIFVGRVLRLRRNTHWQDIASFDSLLSLGILGKGGLFVVPPLEDCLTGLTRSSTQAGTGGTELQLIGTSVPTA